eukprot:6199273-Pleurochrysis_carterae.AAC.2
MLRLKPKMPVRIGVHLHELAVVQERDGGRELLPCCNHAGERGDDNAQLQGDVRFHMLLPLELEEYSTFSSSKRQMPSTGRAATST